MFRCVTHAESTEIGANNQTDQCHINDLEDQVYFEDIRRKLLNSCFLNGEQLVCDLKVHFNFWLQLTVVDFALFASFHNVPYSASYTAYDFIICAL